jgi:hypothetical protein
MYRDKNIEDLISRYTSYLASLESSDITFLAKDPELYIMPEDELTPLIELLEARRKTPPPEYDDSMEYAAGLEYGIEIIEAIL